jgi:membrane associated rhomboid family serine protease
MTTTSVGMRCPECSRERTQVRTPRSISSTPSVTQALIAINVAVFLAELASGGTLGSGTGGTVLAKGALFGPAIADQHQYWRILTGGFLHEGLLHIGVNMLSLYFVGSVLEPAIGRVNYAAIYFASLFAGSFGALLFQPDVRTVGASGAIFGIFGALIVVAHYRGIPIWQSGLGFWLLLNLAVTFGFAGISIGGHLGGLVGGLICGWLIVQVGARRRMSSAALAGCTVIAVAGIAAAIAVAGSHGVAPHGIGFGS